MARIELRDPINPPLKKNRLDSDLLAINPKVGAIGIGGAVAMLLIGALARIGIDLNPMEVQAATILCGFLAGFLVKEKKG